MLSCAVLAQKHSQTEKKKHTVLHPLFCSWPDCDIKHLSVALVYTRLQTKMLNGCFNQQRSVRGACDVE